MSRLNGKTALVTGATGGIGEASAKNFLSEGANVMLVGRSAEKLDATRERLGNTDKLRHTVADAGSEADIATAVAATVEAFGGLDILLTAAGMNGLPKPFEEETVEEFEALMRTNVIGSWLAMKHTLAPMKARGGGSMIAIASIAGTVGFNGYTAYSASKGAIGGLIKNVAVEQAANNVRANAIIPGPIDNQMMQKLANESAPDDPAALRTAVEGMVPMGRYGTNDEIANLATFLASDESSYCTGSLFAADGGFLAV